jgi:hypothetical protein
LKVYENSVLRKILGPKRAEVTGDVRRLHCEDLHYVYYQLDVTWVIKSRRVRGEHNVAHMEEGRNAGRVLAKKT